MAAAAKAPIGRRTLLTTGAGALVTACATMRASPPSGLARIVVTAKVPADSGPVFLTGNIESLGPWNPSALKMEGSGHSRRALVLAPIGERFEFKVTLGSWDREGLGPSGTVMPNFQIDVRGDDRIGVDISGFKKDARVYLADPQGGGVLGRTITWLDVRSQGLDFARHVQIWLPPSYDDDLDRRYPVIYVHDGQNLFDPRVANTGVDWGVDEVLSARDRARQTTAIVVAVWSTDHRRLEYSPSKVIAALPDAIKAEVAHEFGGAVRGDAYIAFLANELKPRVDQAFQTHADPRSTVLMGSSMGGLISFYGVCERPDVFGAALCLATHWPVAIARPRLVEGAEAWRSVLSSAYRSYLADAALEPLRTRLWSDRGGVGLDVLYDPYHTLIRSLLMERGFSEGSRFAMPIFPSAEHNEASWRARLAQVLAFGLDDIA
jgi:hypothetical protein